MKFKKLTEKYLNKYFEDNQIEDDELFECLLDREGVIEEDTKTNIDGIKNKDYMILNIKLKFTSE